MPIKEFSAHNEMIFIPSFLPLFYLLLLCHPLSFASLPSTKISFWYRIKGRKRKKYFRQNISNYFDRLYIFLGGRQKRFHGSAGFHLFSCLDKAKRRKTVFQFLLLQMVSWFVIGLNRIIRFLQWKQERKKRCEGKHQSMLFSLSVPV